MTESVLDGVSGANPLGFFGAIGLLRLLDQKYGASARLRFLDDGSFRAVVAHPPGIDLVGLVADDASGAAGDQPWRLKYEKQERKATKRVADLKAPPAAFRQFCRTAIELWSAGSPEGVEYAAAYATDVAVDGNGNTKPTAFHFTSGQQKFIETLEELRASVTREWAKASLTGKDARREGANLRWDPDAERSRALLAIDPSAEKTSVNAPLEWLAFRGLPAFRCVPHGDRIVTTGVRGRRQHELEFEWLLWDSPATFSSAASLLATLGSVRTLAERKALGVFAVCACSINRTGQGYGSFTPARIT